MHHKIFRRLLPPVIEYSSVIFFATDMRTTNTVQHDTDQTVSYRTFDTPAGSIMRSLCSEFPDHSFEIRMQNKDQKCYVAMINDEPVGFGWVTEKDCPVNEVHMTLPIAKNQFYIYDCFVYPSHRGRGIYRRLLNGIVSDCLSQRAGASSITGCICVVPENTASIRGVQAAGFRKIAQIRYLRIGSRSYLFGRNALLRKLLD